MIYFFTMHIRNGLRFLAIGLSISATTLGYWGSSYEAPGIQFSSLGSSAEIGIGTLSSIGRFRLSNPSKKKIILKSVALKNYGNSNLQESLADASLWANGQQVSSRSWIDRKEVYFSTPDYIIGGGDSIIIDVKATIGYAHDGDTIKLGVKRAEDIVALEMGSGFAVGLSVDDAPTQLKEYSLSPGAIGIRRTPTYRNSRSRTYTRSQYYRYTPTPYYSDYTPREEYTTTQPRTTTYRSIGSQTRSPGSRGVSFLDFYVSQKTPVRADGAFFEVNSASFASDKNGNGMNNELEDFNDTFDSFQLYINGQREDSASYLESYRGKIGVWFDSSFDLMAGDNHFQVTGRIRNEAVDGDKIKLYGGSNFLINPEYLYSGDAVPSSKIHGTPAGSQTDVSGGSSWFLYQ